MCCLDEFCILHRTAPFSPLNHICSIWLSSRRISRTLKILYPLYPQVPLGFEHFIAPFPTCVWHLTASICSSSNFQVPPSEWVAQSFIRSFSFPFPVYTSLFHSVLEMLCKSMVNEGKRQVGITKEWRSEVARIRNLKCSEYSE